MPDQIKDSYPIIQSDGYGEFKDRGSKFLGYAFHATNADEISLHLETIKKEHFKARHHCYAWRLGIDGDSFRMNDDGEPSGTAGKPIYGQILSHELSDILIIVVRYFGGTKLGTSGLIAAYKGAAKEALNSTQIITHVITQSIKLTFEYSAMGRIMNTIKEMGIEIREKVFDANPFIILEIRASEIASTIVKLKAKLLNKSIEEINEETKVPFCTFTEIT